MNKYKKYFLYCHTNKYNGKKYFGITCNLKNRFGKNGIKYLRKNNDGNYVHPLFAKAIVKYGWDGFYHDILFDNLTLNDAKLLEIEYISRYKTNNAKYGYNCTKGGDIVPTNFRSKKSRQKISKKNTLYHINQYSLDGKYIKTWYNCNLIERELKIPSSDIFISISKYQNEQEVGHCHGYLWKKVPIHDDNDISDIIYIPKTNKKQIYCMNLQCDILNKFDSIKDASLQLNITSGEISAVCKNKRKSTHGFRFCYVEDYDNIKNIKYINNKHKSVLLLDKNNNVIKEYNMIIDIAKDLDTFPTVIQKKLKSKTLYKNKYKICYKEKYNYILNDF